MNMIYGEHMQLHAIERNGVSVLCSEWLARSAAETGQGKKEKVN